MRDLRIGSRAVLIVPWTTLLACAGLAITDAVLSAATPGYDVVGDTSSQLMSADEPYATLSRVVFGLYGVLLIPLAVVLWGEVKHHRVAGAVAASGMWLHIISAFIGAVAQNDSDVTVIGDLSANEIHDQSAIVMFAAAAIVLAAVVSVRGGWSSASKLLFGMPVRGLTATLFIIVLVTGTFFVLETWTEWNGVLERMSAGAFVFWMVLFALSLRSARSGGMQGSSS
jgi:hypothetical protein